MTLQRGNCETCNTIKNDCIKLYGNGWLMICKECFIALWPEIAIVAKDLGLLEGI